MKGIKSLFASPVFLTIGVLIFIGAGLAAIFPISDYISNLSVSTTDNFYLIGAMMAILALLAIFEAFLVVRLVWGKGAITGEKAKPDLEDIEGDLAEVRTMRVTGMKKALILGLCMGANVIVFDLIGGGVLLTETRRNHVLTQLRTNSVEERAAAVFDAIQLVGDQGVAGALSRIMRAEGEKGKEWAAYAAGARLDESLAGDLAKLLSEGEPVERAAAAGALARMRDPRLLALVVDAYTEAGDYELDMLIALGMLGKVRDEAYANDMKAAGEFLHDLLASGELDKEKTRVAIWALGMMEAPEGLPYLKKLVDTRTDTTTLCTTLEALGRIGEAASTDNMMAIVNKVDRKERCPEVVATDFAGHEVLLCGGLNLVQRILREVATIGDDQHKLELERIAADETHSEQVRKMAAEIAFQLRYRPVSNK